LGEGLHSIETPFQLRSVLVRDWEAVTDPNRLQKTGTQASRLATDDRSLKSKLADPAEATDHLHEAAQGP
jgi:hypothetical protein